MLTLPKSQSIEIEFHNVRYSTREGFHGPKKQILKSVNGKFKSGELTAIMGPSGAGKSTLLNILTGFTNSNYKGRIDYLSNLGKQEYSEYRKETCYIQQDDRLNPLFTVQEIMGMATDLKLGNSLNYKAKEMLIDDILDTLDLFKTKETRCGRLSGGQKKRLSIALELIDNPPVMFLDEPTTGLDSSSSLQCIAMLQNLARGGRTIVCTIHQPSAAIYDMFDHVYLLADGRCMYQGTPSNTVPFFGSLGLVCPKYHNPADYMIEVVSKEYGNFNEQLAVVASDVDNWRTPTTVKTHVISSNFVRRYSDEGKTTVLITPPSEFTKFWVLLNRCMIQLYRDWTVTHLKLVLHFLVAVLLGLMFTDAGRDGSKTISNVGFFLCCIVYLAYTSMMPAVLKFPQELPVLRKEQFNNWYNLRTYYLAYLVSNLPVQMMFCAVYCSVSYILSSQPMDGTRFFMFLTSLIFVVVISESFGLILGTTVNPVNGTFLGAITMCAMFTFSGFLVLFKDMPRVLYYVSYASFHRYAMEGLVHAIYGFNREKLMCPPSETYCHYRVPQLLLTELSMPDSNYWMNFVILGLNFVVLRFVAYCTLKRNLRSS